MKHPDFSHFQIKIGHHFHDLDILREALTHRSYLNENPSWGVPHNERLEYLGDAVLELAASEFLFRKFPSSDEGDLTSFRAALVNYQILSRIAREIGLGDHIFLSKGEAKDSGKAKEVILANAIESLIGAIYLDGGYESARLFIERFILSRIDEIVSQKLYRDSKSLLQEIIQERLKITPTYRVMKESGPDHKKEFLVGVFFGDEEISEGIGASKQEAESNAARAALVRFGGDA